MDYLKYRNGQSIRYESERHRQIEDNQEKIKKDIASLEREVELADRDVFYDKEFLEVEERYLNQEKEKLQILIDSKKNPTKDKDGLAVDRAIERLVVSHRHMVDVAEYSVRKANQELQDSLMKLKSKKKKLEEAKSLLRTHQKSRK